MANNSRLFIPMKRSTRKAQIGDVFVVQPYDNIFVYGKIIELSDISHSNDVPVVAISKTVTRGILKSQEVDVSDIMYGPSIISNYDFCDGTFMVIRSGSLTPDDLSLDYGFKKHKGSYLYDYIGVAMDVRGNPLDHEPQIIVPGPNVLFSIYNISHDVVKYLENNPKLLANINEELYTDFADELEKARQKRLIKEAEEYAINAQVAPFKWHGEFGASVTLFVEDGYYTNVFQTRDCEGNGYDWEALAKVFIKERMPQLKGKLRYDSEAEMFCALGSKKALLEFVKEFRKLCDTKRI